MVRGLDRGIFFSKKEIKTETLISEIPKRGEMHSFIIDGVSLAYHILDTIDRDYPWDFASGGDYKKYSTMLHQFFMFLNKTPSSYIIVFPLTEGIDKSDEPLLAKRTSDIQEKLKNIGKIRSLAEKADPDSRNYQTVLPTLMIEEIAITATRMEIPVIYTRNPVPRFVANYILSGKADAVIGSSTDYLLFPGVTFIPIDSFKLDESHNLICRCLDLSKTCELIGLSDETKLFDLSVILGNVTTEYYMTTKYNPYTLLHIRPNHQNPTCLIDGIVSWLNSDDYEGLFDTSPLAELIENDADFERAIDDASKFYDVTAPLEEDDTALSRRCESGLLPRWALSISQGADFWLEPTVDDYRLDTSAANVCVPLRQVIYKMLNRDVVAEHVPAGDELLERSVGADPEAPLLEDIAGMEMEARWATFYDIVHLLLPVAPDFEHDPIGHLEEPFRTAALALRFIICQCFTENFAPQAKLRARNSPLAGEEVLGAPPIDFFELKALVAMLIVLNMVDCVDFQAPPFLPSMRRTHVAALFQAVLQHVVWIEQFFEMAGGELIPHYLFDAQLFAACYDCDGDITSEKFLSYLEDNSSLKAIAPRVDALLKIVMFVFPAGLFEEFVNVPRSMIQASASTDQPKTKQGGAEEEDANEQGGKKKKKGKKAPPTVAPPPKAKKEPKKKQQEIDEDEELAFLMAVAAENKAKGGEGPKIVVEEKKKPKTGPPKRRKENIDVIAIQKMDEEIKNYAKKTKIKFL